MEEYNSIIANYKANILIITKNECTLCNEVKDIFDTLELPYSAFNIESAKSPAEEFKNALKTSTTGSMFPFIYIGGEYIGGYKELHRLVISDKLREIVRKIGLDYDD
jgi:glutaredoxin